MIRIVGLSATLPNYEDVAAFLHVSPSTGEGGEGGLPSRQPFNRGKGKGGRGPAYQSSPDG